ncbi:hypothetical protein PFISCL1PPCAC_191, partial [Pristionchus fissidentatus]
MQMVIGAVIAVGGIVGGSFAVWIAQNWKEGRHCFRRVQTILAFPLVGAIGSMLALPTSLLAQPALAWDIFLVYFLNFYTAFVPSGNYVMAMDVLMEVIPSSRRASATSLLYVFAYLLGDCPGPYIAGAISDALRNGSDDPEVRYHALVNALYATSSLFVVCFCGFFAAAYFMKKERLEQSPEKAIQSIVDREDVEMTKSVE